MNDLDLAFVLHRPARGGNVGAAARALTTMGFRDLRISGEISFDEEAARAWAHGSLEVFDSVRRYEDLLASLHDRDLVVGTSARRRGDRRDYFTPQDLRKHLQSLNKSGVASRVAILFGPEDHGLTNDELDICQLLSEVPMRRAYPSLNLAQAVMVYAYELSPLAFTAEPPRDKETDPASLRALHARVVEILPQLGFNPSIAVTQRIVERVGRAQGIDVHLLHSVVNAIEIHLSGKECGDGSP